MKKITGDLAEDHYKKISDDGEIYTLEPEYCTMSNGIGADWYQKYKGDLYPSDETPVIGKGTVIKGTPRFYMEKLKEEDNETFESIKEKRKLFKETHENEFTPDRLMAKYKVKKAATTQLKRDLK